MLQFASFLFYFQHLRHSRQMQDPPDPVTDMRRSNTPPEQPQFLIPSHDHTDPGTVHKSGIPEVKLNPLNIPLPDHSVCFLRNLPCGMMIQLFWHPDH